jgi:hypothetical protein
MRWSRPIAFLVLPLLLACEGPTAVFSGGALQGPVEPLPAGFDFARDAGTVQLETRPEDPYSVNIACTVVGERLYVSAGGNRAQWVENMEADPRVRLRVDGVIYELRAERVTDAAEMDAFAEAWLQHAWARDPRGYDEVFVYRLVAR